jgi:hypothetical protein
MDVHCMVIVFGTFEGSTASWSVSKTAINVALCCQQYRYLFYRYSRLRDGLCMFSKLADGGQLRMVSNTELLLLLHTKYRSTSRSATFTVADKGATSQICNCNPKRFQLGGGFMVSCYAVKRVH